MPATKYQHVTADGQTHKRVSKAGRIYSHVIVNTLPADCPQNGTDKPIVHVWHWVGRPDLVSAALAEARRNNIHPEYVSAEAINAGIRA